MNPSELNGGLQRLCSGFNRSQSDLTPERLEAIFARIGHYTAEAWGLAITVLLCGSHFPTFETILQAIDNAAEDLRLREVRQADLDAQRFFAGDIPAHPERAGDHDYGRLRIKVILAIIGGAGPADVASMLDSQAARFDGYGLKEEAAQLRRMPAWNMGERPTWWERQQAQERAIQTRMEIASYRRIGTRSPDESWPGWDKLGFKTDPQEKPNA